MSRAGMADLFAKRRRKVPPAWRPPTPKEEELQADVAGLLDNYLMAGWRFTHFPAGEKRSVVTGARLKRFGLKRGWPDFQLVSPVGRFHGLELKRAGETLTDDQLEFQSWAEGYGVPYAVAFDLPGVLEILARWDCLRIHIRDGVTHLGEART